MLRLMTSWIGVVWLIAAFAGSAAAQYRPGDQCVNRLYGDSSIAACTREIASGRFKGAALAPLFDNRGSAYLSKGDYDRAIADFNEAIRLDPKDAHWLKNRAFAYDSKGDYDRAIADYSEAIRLDPKDTPSTLKDRAFDYLLKGDFDRAIADFNEAIRLNPKLQGAVEGLNKAKTALAAQQKPMPPQSLGIVPIASPLPATPMIKERRVALVIGNSAYSNVEQLSNPRRDAEAIAEAFRQMGFDATTLESDLSRERLVSVLHSFAAQADTADWAVIYFAGHGLELGGTNYLIPIDARLVADRDVKFEAIPLDQVLDAVEGAGKLRLVLLDACRENPFKMTRAVASRSVGRGFARVEPASGTLVAYAARDGQIASDGDGVHSPFATALLKELPTAGVSINKLFRLVHDDVMDMTGRRQEPYTYGALPGREDYFFVPAR